MSLLHMKGDHKMGVHMLGAHMLGVLRVQGGYNMWVQGGYMKVLRVHMMV